MTITHPTFRDNPKITSRSAIGLNLDGKVGPNDFIGPEGEKGIDNQLYRVLGCVAHFRGPDGSLYFFGNKFAPKDVGAGGAAVGELNGTIIALDLLPMEPIEGVSFIQGDFREDGVLAQLDELVAGRPVDVVVSDMAPNLSGIESSDAARVEHLIELAIDFATHHLKPDGALVCKVFHGSGYSQLVELFREHFRVVKPIKPKSSRDRSSETFLVGIGLKKA